MINRVVETAACAYPLLDTEDIARRVRCAVEERRPFSLIRLGDGEAVALSYGDDMWLQDVAYLQGHWGHERVSLGDLARLRDDLTVAISGADVIGVRDDVVGVEAPDDLLERPGKELRREVCSIFPLRPDEIENLSEIGARRVALAHRSLYRMPRSDHQVCCSAWIHWRLLESGVLNSLLGSVESVGLVTSRPELGRMVARSFGIRTSVVTVPDKFVESRQHGAHVPDRYHQIRSELTFEPGTLVLVGAGIPGKVYCDWLKQAGCIAVDVGAVFDAWIGKASRPRVLESLFGIRNGAVPARLQLDAQAPGDDRVLTPRWKASRGDR